MLHVHRTHIDADYQCLADAGLLLAHPARRKVLEAILAQSEDSILLTDLLFAAQQSIAASIKQLHILQEMDLVHWSTKSLRHDTRLQLHKVRVKLLIHTMRDLVSERYESVTEPIEISRAA